MLVKVRLAQNEDGQEIGRLASQAGYYDDVDWSNVYPYWLVAEDDGIVGAIEVLPGRPFGRLETLCVDDALDGHARAKVVRALLLQGIATLKAAGSQLAYGMIPFRLKAYKKALKKRGGVVQSQGNMVMFKL